MKINATDKYKRTMKTKNKEMYYNYSHAVLRFRNIYICIYAYMHMQISLFAYMG